MKANCCLMPSPAPRREADIYRSLRDTLIRSHCSAKRDHKCCGITITRTDITMNCRLCGDSRQIIGKGRDHD